jgi:hypothetical protein
MNKQRNRVLSFLIFLAVSLSLVGVEWVALAQDPANQNPSTNANKKGKGSAPAVPAPKTTQQEPTQPATPTPDNTSAVSPTTDTPQTETPANANTSTKSTGTPRKGRRQTKAAATPAADVSMAQTQSTDLSGTYSGVLNCPDAGVTGDTTLTITGDRFTLANGTSGRITSATTHGYTAVAMQFGEMPTTPATSGTPVATPKTVSFRAKKSRDRLTLSPVSGGAQCSFSPPGSVARSRKGRGSKGKGQSTAAGEPTSNPAAEPTVVEPTAGPEPPATTPSRKTPSKSRRTNKNSNTGAANTNSNTNPAPSPTPPPR